MKTLIYTVFICLSANTLVAQDIDKMGLTALDSLAEMLFFQGDFEQALVYAERAVLLTKGVDTAYSAHLNNLSSIYTALGKYEQSEPLLLEAKKQDERLLELPTTDYARTLSNLASLYEYTNDFEKAEYYGEQARALQEKKTGKIHPEYAEILNNLGMLNISMGKYEQAEQIFQEVLQIQEKTRGKNNFYYSSSLNNLGLAYQYMGQFAKALPLYQEAMAFSLDNPRRLATQVNNLATLYTQMGDYKKAEAMSIEALKLKEKALGKEHPEYPVALNNVAKLYEFTERYSEAESLYKQAMSLRAQAMGKKDGLYASFTNNLSSIYLFQNKLDTALAYSKAAIAANSIEMDSATVRFEHLDQVTYFSNEYQQISLFNLLKILKARYYKNQNKQALEDWYSASQAAVRLNERIKNDFFSDRSKLRILRNNGSFIKFGLESALLLNEPSHYNEIFAAADMNKSILLADALKANRARALGDLPDSLALQEIELQDKMDKLKKMETQAKNKEDKEKMVLQFNELNAQIELFKKSIKDKYPQYHKLKYENITAKAADIQALLDEKSLLLEYFIADSLVYLFTVDKHKVRLVQLPISKKELTAGIKKLREALTDYKLIKEEADKAYALYTEAAFWMYQNILKPALNNENIHHLIVVADGELGHLPFETFLVEQAGAQPNYNNLHYVINDYTVSYNYSATLWKEILEAPQKKNNGQLFAFAASYKTKSEGGIGISRSPQIDDLRGALKDLPAARAEVEGLSQLFSGEFKLNEDANEGYFKSKVSDYGIIHLAMHGILNKRSPILSSLAFTENGDSVEDNFLEAWEIARLKLNADLVVLSACETGYGQFEQGEGVMSLARSFMYAGAHSLVVSMWEVNDASTSKIMQFFYKNLAAGMDKAQALQQAKIQYLSESKGISAHPAYWSAFVQIGDSRAISMASGGSGWKWWAVGGGVGLLLLGLVLSRLKKR